MAKKNNKVSLHVFIDKEIYDGIRKLCKHHGDITYIVQEVLRKYLQSREEK